MQFVSRDLVLLPRAEGFVPVLDDVDHYAIQFRVLRLGNETYADLAERRVRAANRSHR